MKGLLLILIPSAAFAMQVGTVNQIGSGSSSAVPQVKNLWIVGDSKSTYDQLQTQLVGEFNARDTNNTIWFSAPSRDVEVGRTVYNYSTQVTNSVNSRSNTIPDVILFNQFVNGVNNSAGRDDVWYNGDTNGALFTNDLASTFDYIHSVWPSAQIYVMRSWKADIEGSDFTAKLNWTADVGIPSVVTNRAWCHLGPDERVFLENGDNGATMMTQPEGIHPNSLGVSATASQWAMSVFP